MNVSKKLTLWQSAHLLDSEQVQHILDFEREHRYVWPWFLSVVLLGVFCISLGAISVTAANWEAIPAWCKLSTQAIILAGLAITAVYQIRQKRSWLFEACILALFMFSGSAVALVAQIFQNNTSWSESAFWWCMMTLPIIWLSRYRIVTFIWLTVALGGMICSQTGQLLIAEILSLQIVQTYPEMLWLLPVSITIFFGIVCTLGQRKISTDSGVWRACFSMVWIVLFATLILAMLSAFAVNFASGIRIYVGSIVLLVAINRFARRRSLLHMVNLSRFLLYMVLLCIYIHAFGSLLITGVGFMVNGMIIVLSAIIGRQIIARKKGQYNVKDTK